MYLVNNINAVFCHGRGEYYLLAQFADGLLLLGFLHEGKPEPAVGRRAFRHLRIVENLVLTLALNGHDGEIFGEFRFRFGDIAAAVDFGGELRTVFEYDFRFHISSFPKSS